MTQSEERMETSPARPDLMEARLSVQPKKRKTAYEIRKERKRLLTEQVQTLQKELDRVKFQLLAEHDGDRTNRRIQTANEVLHELIQRQHLVLAGVQTQMTGHAQRNLNALQPVQSVIRLGKDWKERNDVLMGMKQRELDTAERYLRAQSSGLDPRSGYCREERFDSPNEAFRIVRFEMLPIRGASAKDVFDAIVASALNAEMILSEMFGSITVREDTNFDDGEFSQIRLLSRTSSGANVESNTVIFTRFVPETGKETRGCGIMTSDFVDVDELYPYNAHERVRRDSTSVVMVRSLTDAANKEPQVIVTRQTWLKLYRNEENPPSDPERDLKESSVCYGDTASKNAERVLSTRLNTKENSPCC